MNEAVALTPGERAWKRFWVVWLMAITVVGICHNKVGHEGDFITDYVVALSQATKDAIEQWALHGAYAMCILAACYVVGTAKVRIPRGLPLLLIGALVLAKGAVYVGGMVGQTPGWSLGHHAGMVMVLAVGLSAWSMPQDFLQVVRVSCRWALVAALLAALIVPGFVLETGYQDSYLFGWEVRFHGLCAHAHQTATLAFLLGIIAFSRTDRWRKADLALSLAVMVFAQSKQFLVISLVTYGMYVFFTPVSYGGVQVRDGLKRGFVVAFVLMVVLLLASMADPWSVIVPSGQSENAETLTGRTKIWEVTLDHWRLSPWFGHGPRAWIDYLPEHFEELHGWRIYHSHSQWHHMLEEGGIIGVLCWSVAFMALTYLLGSSPRDRFVRLGLIAVFWLRSFVEPYFYANSVDAGSFLFLVGVVVALQPRSCREVASYHV